jgi:hypothetical protein
MDGVDAAIAIGIGPVLNLATRAAKQLRDGRRVFALEGQEHRTQPIPPISVLLLADALLELDEIPRLAFTDVHAQPPSRPHHPTR